MRFSSLLILTVAAVSQLADSANNDNSINPSDWDQFGGKNASTTPSVVPIPTLNQTTAAPVFSSKNPSNVLPTDAGPLENNSTSKPVVTSAAPLTEVTETVETLNGLDKIFYDWFTFTDKLVNTAARYVCLNTQGETTLDDCKSLKIDVNETLFHKMVHDYIYNPNEPTYEDHKYEYYREADWELFEPPMFSERTEIDGKVWYRRPLWAQELHAKKGQYPEKFPVGWIYFEDSKEKLDDEN